MYPFEPSVNMMFKIMMQRLNRVPMINKDCELALLNIDNSWDEIHFFLLCYTHHKLKAHVAGKCLKL